MGAERARPRGTRPLSGLLVSVALVAAVTALIALLEPHVPGLLGLPSLYLLAVLPVALWWGVGFAVAVAVASSAVFAYLFVPPARSVEVDPQHLIALGVFLVTAVVVGQLAARSRRVSLESARLAQEQAALRRVATLVARSVPSTEVFAAVTREVGLLCGADLARMERYEGDGSVMGVAGWSDVPVQLAVGARFDLEGLSVARRVRQTGGPVRLDSYRDAAGPIAREARDLGIRSSVGCPVIVDGRLWGVIAASSRSEDAFPADTESQIAQFTELVATAIGNAASGAEVTRLLDQQDTLRRVATSVARGVPPTDILGSVAGEIGRVFRADAALMVRLDTDGGTTVVGKVGDHPDDMSVGSRWVLGPDLAMAEVLQTARPARRDDYGETAGAFADVVRRMGIRSSVAIPILVGDRIWGALGIGTTSERFPDDTEQRLAGFTELVAMAIGNAESRAEVAASRARVVAASDHTRRRIERDLHDGAQQRLVSLGLELRLAQGCVPAEHPEVRAMIGEAADGLDEVFDELREISRGIHPAILSEGGLAPTLRALARRSPVPVELDIRTGRRFPEPIEVASYYVVSEALANTAKHAGASHASVGVEMRDGALRLSVCDDGIGGADPVRGTGLVGLRDRVEALGGTFEVSSPAGNGTAIRATLPDGSARGPDGGITAPRGT
jgi:signal transduction histidine kinase